MNIQLFDALKTREQFIRNNIHSAITGSEDLVEDPIVDDDGPLQVDQEMRFDFLPPEEQHSNKSAAARNNFISLTDALYEAFITNDDRRQDTLTRQFQLSLSQQIDDSMTPYSIDWGLPKRTRYQAEGGGQA
jgi:hypothetical protein